MTQWTLFGGDLVEAPALAIQQRLRYGRAGRESGRAAPRSCGPGREAEAALRGAGGASRRRVSGWWASRFTVADINLAEIVRYAQGTSRLMAAHPAVDAWLRACQARPGLPADVGEAGGGAGRGPERAHPRPLAAARVAERRKNGYLVRTEREHHLSEGHARRPAARDRDLRRLLDRGAGGAGARPQAPRHVHRRHRRTRAPPPRGRDPRQLDGRGGGGPRQPHRGRTARRPVASPSATTGAACPVDPHPKFPGKIARWR